ncbi:hypothetical protein NZK33_03970 [Cyanobium sp. FGCU-6]|nr:hypothetical protein [Cyanobium sp. FGCU6]
MTRRETTDLLFLLDGTSQQDRTLAALDPQAVPIDGRSDADLIAFVQKLTRHLIFTPGESHWDALATPSASSGLALSPADMAAYIDDPERFSGEAARWLARPHFALLLTCVALLRHLRDQQNGLVRRHLDHFYRDQLGMTPLPARPDRVAVLFRPARGVQEVLLPAGTRLNAGKDSRNRPRDYRSDDDLLIRRTRVSELRTVFVDRRITSLESLGRVTVTPGSKRAWFEQALRLALGAPEPGDAVPPWPHPEGPAGVRPAAVNVDFLAGWTNRLNDCTARLQLLHQEFRELMRLYRRRTDPGSEVEWEAINRLMGFTTAPADPRDFLANLQARVGPLDFDRDGLSQVNAVEDLYRYRDEPPVRSYIETELAELADTPPRAAARFAALMAIKLRIDADWRQIRRLLEKAGRKARPADPSWRLKVANPADFQAMLEAALSLPPGNWPAGQEGVVALEAYDLELRQLEKHLSMPVERIQVLAGAAEAIRSGAELAAPSRERLLALLADAHRERFQARGRERLEQLRLQLQAAGLEGANVFDALVSRILTDLALLPPSPATDWGWDGARAELLPSLTTGELTVLDGFRQQLQEPGVVPRRFDWPEVLVVLESAQRRIAGVADPEPRTVEWRTLELALDPRAQRLGSGRWPTFGRRSAQIKEQPPEPALGFALLSPLLNLSQGERTLALTLGFATEGFDRDTVLKRLGFTSTGPAPSLTELCNANLIVRVSGSQGWIPLRISRADLSDAASDYWTFTGMARPPASPLAPSVRPALKLTLEVESSVDAFAPAEGEASPILQVLLRPMWESAAGEWITTGAFEPLRLEAAHLRVMVKGLTDLALQQEDRRLDARKPFEPFGSQPPVGSRFYVSHPELIANRLDSLSFQLQWTGLGKGLGDQYRNYTLKAGRAPTATDFKVHIDLIDQQRRLLLSLKPESQAAELPAPSAGVDDSLFAADTTVTVPASGTTPATTSSAASSSKTITLVPQGDDHAALPGLQPGKDLRQDRRVWCWTLTPIDFGHSLYPALAAAKAQELAIALATRTPTSPSPNALIYQVDPPYTPCLKGLSVDYTASVELLPQALPPGSELLYVHPFGVSRVPARGTAAQSPSLMPAYTAAGELYIGLAEAELPQRLSLLVQLAEGTSNPDLEPGSLRWQILDGEQWTDLTVRSDGTVGFLHSGIVVLDLPAAAPSRWLPGGGLQWLRVSIDRDPTSVCDCVDLHAQALMATRHDEGIDPHQESAPLPPGSIKALMTPDARIAAIEQPYSSFEGRPGESVVQLDRRVSEGLRHRGRALAAWDYERLVLEEFGSRIHKVKAIAGPGDGLVKVIVIPDLRGALPADALAPKAPANLLEAIRRFLQARAPEAATVKVHNAVFLPVRIRLGVRFREGQEERFSRQRLEGDLVRFLSPWAYDEGAEIRIGNTLYATSIVDFADRLDYVDYVAQIKLFLLDLNGNPTQEKEGIAASIQAPGPDTVLVSSRQHRIDLISEIGYDAQSFSGIGYMQIEFDFIIAQQPS